MTRKDDEKKKRRDDRDHWNPFGPGDPGRAPPKFGNDWSAFFNSFNRFFRDPDMFRPFEGMIRDLMDQLRLNPGMTGSPPGDVEDRDEPARPPEFPQVKGPFVYGFNMSLGPDGKPKINSFGNVRPRGPGKTEVTDVRDPLVDVMEEDESLVVVAELPGVTKQDIKLRATETSLNIRAVSEDGARQYEKNLELPAKINPNVAKARYQNGILEVRLTKIDDAPAESHIPVE